MLCSFLAGYSGLLKWTAYCSLYLGHLLSHGTQLVYEDTCFAHTSVTRFRPYSQIYVICLSTFFSSKARRVKAPTLVCSRVGCLCSIYLVKLTSLTLFVGFLMGYFLYRCIIMQTHCYTNFSSPGTVLLTGNS